MANDKNATQDGEDEFQPVNAVEDLTEPHQKQYTKIVDDLKKKLLAMYTKSHRGMIKLHGVPMSLKDEVDLTVPSYECTQALREEIERITAHALI